jgi:hypothetical protein
VAESRSCDTAADAPRATHLIGEPTALVHRFLHPRQQLFTRFIAMDLKGHEQDILLFAYVDGELDRAGRMAVERIISKYPEVTARIRIMHEINHLLYIAYKEE